MVSGQPRSGTSLMMRVLHNSGFAAISDDLVSYELKATADLKTNRGDWIDGLPFNSRVPLVVKILYPHLIYLPAIGNLRYRVIWMHRNPREQAKSQRKFLTTIGRPKPRYWVGIAMAMIRRIEERFPREVSQQSDVDLLRVSFESLIRNPKETLESVGGFLDWKLDPSPVLTRSPRHTGTPVGLLEITRPQEAHH